MNKEYINEDEPNKQKEKFNAAHKELGIEAVYFGFFIPKNQVAFVVKADEKYRTITPETFNGYPVFFMPKIHYRADQIRTDVLTISLYGYKWWRPNWVTDWMSMRKARRELKKVASQRFTKAVQEHIIRGGLNK